MCPYDVVIGYCLFAEDEFKTAIDEEPTRADMEAHVVVNLAGRCAEKLVLGESEVTCEWEHVCVCVYNCPCARM